MKFRAKVRFLVRNIVLGNVTYLEVMESDAVKDDPTLKTEIDAYIESQDLDIDKTV
jgi:hypothetical protein